MPIVFADGDQDYIEKFNTVAQQAFDGDAAAGRLDDHIDGTADKHGASAIVNTPAGSIAATDVQAAINELDTEKQPIDATLTALAGVTTAADKLIYATGADTFATTDLTSAGRALLDDADASAQRTTLGLGTAATLASDTDTTLAANSDTRLATQKAVKAYVDALIAASDAVVFKGVTDCSANPNYPAADAGHLYIVSVAGKIGGASGVSVEAGDMFICKVDGTASGNQAAVGANWGVVQTNINGALTTADLGVTVAALAGAAFTGLSSVTANSATAALTLSNAGAGAALTADKQIVSTLATGTAPFSVASTTNVANLNASSLSGATFAAPGTIGGGTPGAATFTTLTATGQVSLGGAAGAEGLRVTTTASAVNYARVQGATTGGIVYVGTQGSDTNAPFAVYSKGVSYVGVFTNGGSNTTAVFRHIASSVNWIDFYGSAAGNAVATNSEGSDTNIGYNVSTKGNGAFRVFTAAYTAEQFRVAHTASAIDYMFATGSSAAFPGLYAAGSSTNVNVVLSSKGTGGVYACTNGGTAQALFTHTASAVNYHSITGSATGGPVSFSATGSDSNIDLALFSKGTGVLRFGTHSAIAAETVTGYITIKDAGGTVRKLAVVS